MAPATSSELDTAAAAGARSVRAGSFAASPGSVSRFSTWAVLLDREFLEFAMVFSPFGDVFIISYAHNLVKQSLKILGRVGVGRVGEHALAVGGGLGHHNA